MVPMDRLNALLASLIARGDFEKALRDLEPGSEP